MRTLIFAVGLLLVASAIEAQERVASLNCPVQFAGTQLPATCEIQFHPTDARDHNLTISANIDLQPMIDSFATKLGTLVDRHSCRSRAKVRSAHLTVKDGYLDVSARVWIEKRICEGPLRTRLFEMSGDIVLRLETRVDPGELRLEATLESLGLSEFEQSFVEVLGFNPQEALERALEEKLRVRIADAGLPPEIAASIAFRSASVHANPPILRAELTASLNTQTLARLLNLGMQAAQE